uniref:Sulfotransferase n=1 Tax=Meloidogyne floridensis TaxID=298350 RepID=A0A915NQG7_9BILA
LLAPVLILLSTHFPTTKQTSILLPPQQPENNEKPLIALMTPQQLPSAPQTCSKAFQYAKFIHSNRGRFSAFLLAIILYIVGTSLNQHLSHPKQNLDEPPKSHPNFLLIHLWRILWILWGMYLMNFSHFYSSFNKMVAELEGLPESWGPNRTLLFLRPYEEFDKKNAHFWQSLGLGPKGKYKFSLDNLPFFMNSIGNPPTVKYEKNGNGSIQLKSFQFSIVNKGMTEWWNRAVMEEKVRIILEKYEKNFNASMYDADS